MKITGTPSIYLREDAKTFVALYMQLGEKAENFLPNHIFEKLAKFVRLCYEQPDDPSRQNAEIDKQLLELKESIPGYVDVSLMLFPHENSKAYQYSSKRNEFVDELTSLIDTESVDATTKVQTQNILNSHDFSIGTPPVTQQLIDYLNKLLLGESATELRKFKEVIGIKGDNDTNLWNYLLDVLDQMIIQSTHYTTDAEKRDFIEKTELTVNFKGLNGFIRSVVGGCADTAIKLISEEVFRSHFVKVINFETPDVLFETIKDDFTNVHVVKIKSMRNNFLNEHRWFPHLTRLIFVDDSPESQSTNTSLVFCFHNGVIAILDKVHTKKMGALANSQLNLRLVIEKINLETLIKFKNLLQTKIDDYEDEFNNLKKEQVGETDNLDKTLVLCKFDDFAKQIIKDKFALTKLRDYLILIINTINPQSLQEQNLELIFEYEERMRTYFYSGNKKLHISTIIEGGGRNQIKTYGDYLLLRKLKPIDQLIQKKCRTILNIIPNNYERTLHNHFHKNFGLNLFLEKYKEFLTKAENEADNKGRFINFLIDLGIKNKFDNSSDDDKVVFKNFISDLGNLDKTSISDDVQMIIRDILFHREGSLRPYILYNMDLSWEYMDLFPPDRFDINPFDLEIGTFTEGRIDFERLTVKLSRMKNTFQLFDDSGNLWDRFCENLTIIINDPSNPSGYTDFNNEHFLLFLKFINTSKITLFLDEAYSDSVKLEDESEPKWRSISRYIMNNMTNFANISAVASLSTTKNLSGTGLRLGTLVATPARKDVIVYAKKCNSGERSNTNSLYVLVNVIEEAQMAKKLKDAMEERLPKNASINSFKKRIEESIKSEIKSYNEKLIPNKKNTREIKRFSLFEGSPLHIFLLDELNAIDKLELLHLPDDFMYKGMPFFTYYQKQLLRNLNLLRVNKQFLYETTRRMKLAKDLAEKVLTEKDFNSYATIIDSDGSYLFNLQLKDFFSYQNLEIFCQTLAEKRGISVIPYKTGFVRFSLGGYLNGSEKSYADFSKELRNALEIFIKYWKLYTDLKANPDNKGLRPEDLMHKIFAYSSEKEFINQILSDFYLVKDVKKVKPESLKISKEITLYHSFAQDCGVSINFIPESKNAVYEFFENIGECRNLTDFIKSKAFTKIYENLLPQVYKNIPFIKKMDINTVLAIFGKPTILKYIQNKLDYQPNSYVLDDPHELNVMKEILIEMEKALFSDAKFKIMTLVASENVAIDQQRLEGANSILKKHIRELLIHFNLPFANPGVEPSLKEIVTKGISIFIDLTGKPVEEFGIKSYLEALVRDLRNSEKFRSFENNEKLIGLVLNAFAANILSTNEPAAEKILKIYLIKRNEGFEKLFYNQLTFVQKELQETEDFDVKLIKEDFTNRIFVERLNSILSELFSHGEIKILQDELSKESRKIAQFLVDIINRTKSTEYYDIYTHTLMRFIETEFKKQNSSINEMIQHGLSIYKQFDAKNPAFTEFRDGALNWIGRMMSECGTIAVEQPVQTHTRVSTDAKKRIYPIHKIDRTPEEEQIRANQSLTAQQNPSPNDYIKNLATKPENKFFERRLQQFIANIDTNEYICKITDKGLIKELLIIQKTYLKFLADNYRLLDYEDVSLEQARNFVPDVILILGAPEKVISYPQIGYFDIEGPNGKIKTLITPLKKNTDYFGNVKKPRLTLINEKVKEMGGYPVHGSMFAVEEEDGGIFVVQVSGDSGVGKSEMLAALMLKWLKKDLTRVRSIKLIAGDMLHIFPDKEGNLYGIGTEAGDFSRVTDFDPEYIKYYNTLFESASDSNADDLNSRSTISGLCDITMPYKIDIMLTASNYARQEAGIIRHDNPENFLYYRESHGERKEKATSSDHPHLQRTLLRYPADTNIVNILDKHGNYLDDVLDWDQDEQTGTVYLCSSYKMIDKIDIEDIVRKIFNGKTFTRDNIKYQIVDVQFDIIKNRFLVKAQNSDSFEISFLLDKMFFSSLFNALASTPTGQPFISEESQLEGKQHLANILRGKYGKGKGSKIQLGTLSTDLGKKGREISGPQKAAEELKKLIQEVRIANPDINNSKQKVRNIVQEKYRHIFNGSKYSPEIHRYNFVLWQIEQMRKADFVRLDDVKESVDLSRLRGFKPLKKNHEFSPLLVTPNINMELNCFGETYEQLIDLPNNKEFAAAFAEDLPKLYVAEGYSDDVKLNNMVLQLLLLKGHIKVEDLNRGRIMEKINRETLAAAKYAVVKMELGITN